MQPEPAWEFAALWRDGFGDRAFRYDAFLSHNRGDGSAELAAAPHGFGVELWHDDAADLLDRQVRKRIAVALAAARRVVVCVDAGSLGEVERIRSRAHALLGDAVKVTEGLERSAGEAPLYRVCLAGLSASAAEYRLSLGRLETRSTWLPGARGRRSLRPRPVPALDRSPRSAKLRQHRRPEMRHRGDRPWHC